MARLKTRSAPALIGTLLVVVLVPWLAGAVIGPALTEPDPDRPAWATSLVLPLYSAVIAAGILIVGVLGWGARSRLVGILDALAGTALLLVPAVSLVVLDTLPSLWVTGVGVVGGSMVVTGAASLVASRSDEAGVPRRSLVPWPTGRWAGDLAAIAVATAALLADMGFTYVVLQSFLSIQDAGGDLSVGLRGLIQVVGILVEAAAVLVVGAVAVRARSLLVGAACGLAGIILLALPAALTVQEAVPPWWVVVIPAAGEVEAALLLAGLLSIGLAIRDRRRRPSGGTPTDERIGEERSLDAAPTG